MERKSALLIIKSKRVRSVGYAFIGERTCFSAQTFTLEDAAPEPLGVHGVSPRWGSPRMGQPQDGAVPSYWMIPPSIPCHWLAGDISPSFPGRTV